MNINVLVVEDERKVSSFIKQGLEEIGCIVDVANDGLEGIDFIESGDYDVAIIDLLLPQIHGLEVCRQLRKNRPKTKILILSALSTLDNKLLGFEYGADDYLVKPFEFLELIARLKSLMRRDDSSRMSDVLQISDLIVNVSNKTVFRRGVKIDLTAKEFQLLELLMRNKGRVMSKAEIAEKVWDVSFDSGTNVIEVYINFLRKKIDRGYDPKLIHTLIGMGYIMKEA